MQILSSLLYIDMTWKKLNVFALSLTYSCCFITQMPETGDVHAIHSLLL